MNLMIKNFYRRKYYRLEDKINSLIHDKESVAYLAVMTDITEDDLLLIQKLIIKEAKKYE